MKCPLCNNNGKEIAFIQCFAAALYYRTWFVSQGGESELDEWDHDELVLVTCSHCDFTGLPGMFEDEIELLKIERDEHGPYIDNFSTQIGSCTLRGKLYLNEEVADKCMRLYMILTATSVAQLPEGLVDGAPELRKVAATRFAKFASGGKQ